MPDSRGFSWKPLGGLGEVGMNCMLLRFGETCLPVDCGILFADPNNFGIEAILPDFENLLKEERIDHWLITHAHEDHIGAIPHVFMAARKLGVAAPQFWAPPFARALICEKLSDSRYPGLSQYKDLVHEVKLDEDLEIAGVRVRFIEVRHSTLDSCSLAFSAEIDGHPIKVFHSADLKIDFHEFEDGVKSLEAFNAFGGVPPDIMFLDSTNADRPGQSVSETEIFDPLARVIEQAPQRLFVTLFSSNVYRIAALLHLAERAGRKVAIAGRSMQTAYRLAGELGSFGKLPKFSLSTLVAPEMLAAYPESKQMILCSGSQGEVRSVLSKVAAGTHPEFVLHSGDTVLFSSKVIPGNERAIAKTVNQLLRLGARVLWAEKAKEAAGGPIHASGHGRRAELKALLDYLKPDILIPVHGQRFQLEACAELAREASGAWNKPLEVYLHENHDDVSFHVHQGRWVKTEHLAGDPHAPKTLRLEKFYSPSRDPFLIPRKRAASGGCVSLSVRSSGLIDVLVRGVFPEALAHERPYAALVDEIEDFVRALLKSSSKHGRREAGFLEEELGRYLRRVLGTRPLVLVHLEG